jgi:hypothetical protein
MRHGRAASHSLDTGCHIIGKEAVGVFHQHEQARTAPEASSLFPHKE